MTLNCSDYDPTLMAVRALVAPERREEIVGRLGAYAANVGAEFDQFIDHVRPNEIPRKISEPCPS
jgi:hypothetical protein